MEAFDLSNFPFLFDIKMYLPYGIITKIQKFSYVLKKKGNIQF